MADVAKQTANDSLLLSTTVTRTRRHTELTKENPDKLDGKQRTWSSVFRAVFYTVKRHSLTYSVWGTLQ
jgi:hypothetical protein